MNQVHARSVAACGLIALGLCGGAYAVFVEPLDRKAAAALAEAESLRDQAAASEALKPVMDRVLAAAAGAAKDRDEIEARGRAARDEREAFVRLTDLAAAHGVTLHSLTRAGDGPAPARGDRPAGPRDVSLVYNASLTATFDGLARFVRDVQGSLGYAVVRSLQVSPVPDPTRERVQASIQVEFLAFDTSPPPEAKGAPGVPGGATP